MNLYRNIFDLLKNNNYESFINRINELDDKFDLNIRDENDIYLLQHIVLLNNPLLLETILKKSCKIDIIDKNSKSILYLPIIYNYVNIIKILLDYNKITIGISILDIKDNNNNTPLHYSIINKNYTITKLLLEYNASIHDVDINGYNSLHHAIYSRSENIVDLILNKKINCNLLTKNGESALYIAVNLQLYEICNKLLENGCDVNCQNQENELTPLHYVANNNNINIAELLLKFNPDLNLQDNRGNTPIHYALIEHNMNILLLFLKTTHINYNLWNIDGNIILHIILSDDRLYNNINLDNIIFKTNLSIQNNDGNTCLYLLIKNNIWKNYIDILKKKKLDIFLVNKENEYMIDLIEPDDMELFIDMITEGYINNLRRSESMWKDELDLMCSYKFDTLPDEIKKIKKIKNKDNLDKECYNLIKKKILDNITNRDKSYCKYKSCIKIDDGLKISFCTYTGSILDVLIGLIYLLKKHNSACSIINYSKTKNIELCKFYKSKGIIVNSNCESLYFEIMWINYKLYIVDNFVKLVNRCREKKSFVIIPIGIELENGGHANYIIYDIRHNTVERFEPHGNSFPMGFNYKPELLDESLELYFKNIDQNIKYIKPKDYMPKIGFQIMDIMDKGNKKIGDPGGFCALWSLWYVDMRLLYKDIDRNTLVNELIKTIKYNNLSFKNLIRNYSKNITDLRDEILKKSNMDINDWLNDVITNTQIDSLIKQILDIISNY